MFSKLNAFHERLIIWTYPESLSILNKNKPSKIEIPFAIRIFAIGFLGLVLVKRIKIKENKGNENMIIKSLSLIIEKRISMKRITKCRFLPVCRNLKVRIIDNIAIINAPKW